ncbi:TetR/AcrR family transcriptional regulator [Nonomuraea sp. B19D2]|uniref:TetR/AcrR family transcriptional regulator n=1 Tax=Nonomuraea sp. B19D2 TaxID=3159561 RepID=UPI0032D9C4E6
MPRGPTQRRPRTRARLLEAAFAVFADRGFHGTSIEDICNHAGFTRGAFYSNFTTKDELFLALFDAHTERVLERLRAIDPPESDGDVFANVISAATQPSDDERRWYLITTEFTLYAIRNPDAARALAVHENRLREAVAKLLGDLCTELGVEPSTDLDDLARLVIAVIEGARAQSYVQPDELPPGRLERTFLPPILHAFTRSVR